MAKQAYITKRFKPERMAMILRFNDIVEDFASQGFRMTTRQIYYQLVKAGVIPNTVPSYKNLADTINDGKLAGRRGSDWPQRGRTSTNSSTNKTKAENEPETPNPGAGRHPG